MRVLFVAMSESVHTARWIRQLEGLGWDIHLFPLPAEEEVRLHPDLRRVTVHDLLFGLPPGADETLRVENHGMPRVLRRLPRWADRRRVRRRIDKLWPVPQRLARTIEAVKPDVVHAHELLKCGYAAKQALDRVGSGRPAWIASNWGSELSFLARREKLRDRAVEVLSNLDFYTSECERDVLLASAFGFNGTVLGVIPNAGGMDTTKLEALKEPGPSSARRTIALKGYQGWSGRAMTALRAIELCTPKLAGYRIRVYSAGTSVGQEALRIGRTRGLDVDLMPPCPHEEILRLHGMSRISIGVSASDGISTSMVEAMAMGSFPIQSDSSCANEWLTSGETGFLVGCEDVEGIASCLSKALEDDGLIDRAARLNSETVRHRLDHGLIAAQAAELYRRAAPGAAK